MSMRRAFLLVAFAMLCGGVLLFVSCKQKGEVCYKFDNNETITIPLDKYVLPLSRLQCCKIDGKEMVVANFENSELAFYDIAEKMQVHVINLLKDRGLCAFEYVNKDSIFLLYTLPYSYYRSGISDSVILADTLSFQLIDYDGNVKKCYHFNCDGSNIDGVNLTVKDVLPPYSGSFYHKIMRSGNMVFFYPCRYLYNDVENMRNSKPFIACYDLNTEKYYFTKQKFPYLNDTTYCPILEGSSNFLYFCISPDGLPVLRFSYSSDVFEWDYKNDVLIPHTLKSRIIDTTFLRNASDWPYYEGAYYSDITYDPHMELYYSSIMFKLKNVHTASTIIADRNFNYICETSGFFDNNTQFFHDTIINAGVSLFGDPNICISKYKLSVCDSCDSYVDSMRNLVGKAMIND